MFANRVLSLLVVTLGVAISSGYASGQAPMRTGVPSPPTDVGGFASQELRSLYRQGIGIGYTGESLNRLALSGLQPRVPNVGQVTTQPGARIGAGLPMAGSKPFEAFTPSPTVSPYMHLFREDLSLESDLNYQTLVRPQLQQQQFNQQVQRQAIEADRRLREFAAQPIAPPMGTRAVMPTGHPTTHMYHGRYYQFPRRR